MAVEQVSIRNHLVMRDDTLTPRWYDAFGPSVFPASACFAASASLRACGRNGAGAYSEGQGRSLRT